MIDIDNMQAGRELDALIAEKVMGLRVYRNPAEYAKPFILTLIDGESDYPPFRPEQMCDIPNYSTNIADAWQVVERLDYLGYISEIDSRKRVRVWSKRMNEYGPYPVSAGATTIPLAICRAALKVVTV